MTPLVVAKSVLLAVPLGLLLGGIVRGPAALRWLTGAFGGVLLALLAGALVPSGVLAYLTSFVLMAGVYGVVALGLNVQWGYTGLFNIGVAAFFSLGAFTTALVTTTPPTGAMASFSRQAFGLGAPFLVGVAAAAAACAVLAFLIGRPTLRLREDYLAIATIGIAEVVRLVFQNERWLANGPQPLRGIPQPLSCLVRDPMCSWLPSPLRSLLEPLTPRDYPFVYVAIVALVLALVYAALERAIRSPWGRVLRAIREEEASAAMSGKDVAAFKMQAFVVGAAIMGIGGALYAHYIVSISYADFDPLYATFLIWVMLMLGGSGNNRGAILGAFLIWGIWSGTSFLVDALRPLLASISPALPARGPYVRFLLIAVLLLVIVVYRPRGILAEERFVSLTGDEDADA